MGRFSVGVSRWGVFGRGLGVGLVGVLGTSSDVSDCVKEYMISCFKRKEWAEIERERGMVEQ